jgi:hypothetical protein
MPLPPGLSMKFCRFFRSFGKGIGGFIGVVWGRFGIGDLRKTVWSCDGSRSNPRELFRDRSTHRIWMLQLLGGCTSHMASSSFCTRSNSMTLES